ncbi:MAG: hypothetical protein JO267_02190 [Alphaproteobacteria bacterium]|nr:hypothetical protein [Alphaproteobacteria bacterium]
MGQILGPVPRFTAVLILAAAMVIPGPGRAAEFGHKEPAPKDANNFIRMAPIQVPIIAAGSVVGQAGVLVQLQLADPGQFDFVDKRRDLLLDAFLSEFYGLADQLEGTTAAIDPAIVKDHLLRTADRVLGPGKIVDLVILRSYNTRNPS